MAQLVWPPSQYWPAYRSSWWNASYFNLLDDEMLFLMLLGLHPCLGTEARRLTEPMTGTELENDWDRCDRFPHNLGPWPLSIQLTKRTTLVPHIFMTSNSNSENHISTSQPLNFQPPSPGIDDVVHGICGRHALGFGDLPDALGAKGALRVDVHHLEGAMDGSRNDGRVDLLTDFESVKIEKTYFIHFALWKASVWF